MPYKDPIKQREYKRIWEAKRRGTLEPRNRNLMEPNLELKPKKKMEPRTRTVEPEQINELKNILFAIQNQLANITASLTKQDEQLTSILTQLFTRKQTNISPSPRKTTPQSQPKAPQTKLSPEALEKKRAREREYNKNPHRKAQLAKYQRDARARKKLEKETPG